jgi:hypothetical protein
LLQGLLDTDGGMEAKSIMFTSVSQVLAEQVRELVWSLGGTCKTMTKQPTYRNAAGDRVAGKTAYRLTMRLPIGVCPFRLIRKVERWQQCRPGFITPPRRTVKAVDYVGPMQARCITVEADDHLYLTDGFVVTHNSWTIAELAASDKVGRVLWLDIGEGSADEYGDAITGEINYEVIVHDGSWASIYGQIADAHAEAARARTAGELPVCLGIDSGSLLWEMQKDWAAERAKGNDRNKRALAQDPNAEIKVPNHIWNDVHARWNRMKRLLMTFPGICVITARGRETVKVDKAGNPIEGETVYKVEAQRGLQFDATVWLRLSRDAPPMIVGARSKHLRLRFGKDEARLLPADATLEDLIFKGLRCSVDSQPRNLVQLGRERTPEQIRDDALATTDREELLELLAEASHPGHVGVTVENEHGGEEFLTDVIKRRGLEVTGKKPEKAWPDQPDNRFYRERQNRQAQHVPPAPDPAGTTPNDPAPAELIARMQQALTACGSATRPAQLAACAGLLGRSIGKLTDLTRAEANRVGQRAQAAARQPNPQQALAALVAQAVQNRKAS